MNLTVLKVTLRLAKQNLVTAIDQRRKAQQDLSGCRDPSRLRILQHYVNTTAEEFEFWNNSVAELEHELEELSQGR